MKNTTFLIILAVYGLISGLMLLFNSAGALTNYGLPSVDMYHVAISEYIGITDIGLAILAYLTSKSGSNIAIRNLLLIEAIITIGSFLKGCYDSYIVNIPTNNYFWIDSTIRLIIGAACIYFFMNTKKNEIL